MQTRWLKGIRKARWQMPTEFSPLIFEKLRNTAQ
jgi:hypothetical protein